jgi:hypothetical protein
MADKQQQNEREGFQRRGEAINNLRFTYKRLLRLLPAIIRRAPEPRLADVLLDQHILDVKGDAQLTNVAMDLEQPPAPCVCEESNVLVENVYNADRASATPTVRTWGIVSALKAVRTHIIRTWGKLIGDIDPPDSEKRSSIHKAAAAVQQQEAVQHQQLANFTNELAERKHDDHDGDERRRTA